MKTACLLLVLLLVIPALAAENAAPAASADISNIPKLIAQLDSQDPEQRQQATSALMLHEGLTDDHLSAALRTAVSPEQRHRLTLVAMHRFYARMNPTRVPLNEGTGSIGIDIDVRNVVRPDQHPDLDHAAMLISRTRAGFPGFALLRPGDLVVGIDGQPFGEELDQQTFINAIQRYEVGETMKLDVLRAGRRIVVPIQLDSLRRLQEVHARLAGIPDPASYAPWQIYLANLLDSDEPAPTITVESPLPEGHPARVRQEQVKPAPAQDAEVRVLPGGHIQIDGEVRGEIKIEAGRIRIAPAKPADR